MMLIISLLLALIPLLGVGWIVATHAILSVDGLFMSLILLAMSGILVLNAFLELRRMRSPSTASGTGAGTRSATPAGPVTRGRVESVQFYEANVGQPNKSIVILSDGGKQQQTVVLEGDVRNALPTGRKVQFTIRKEHGNNVLAHVSYS